jgi:enoyl-CoA hydratase
MSDGVLKAEVRDRVGTITINRMEKGNALTVEVLRGLMGTLSEWAREGECRVVVVRGAGERAFCGGFEVGAIPTDAGHENAAVFMTENPVEGGLGALKEFPYPTIAMLNGYTVGAGFNLAMCCDLRLAADHVRMGIPPAKLGLVYPADGLRQVVEAIGMARAREVFFTGKIYGPAEVKEMGLVHHVVPAAELEKAVYALAGEIADNAPLSLKGMKRILAMIGSSTAFSAADREEANRLVAESFMSADAREGQAAFLQKRKPEFKGK